MDGVGGVRCCVVLSRRRRRKDGKDGKECVCVDVFRFTSELWGSD